jgi:hypothetical protein
MGNCPAIFLKGIAYNVMVVVTGWHDGYSSLDNFYTNFILFDFIGLPDFLPHQSDRSLI